ncbi:hypothetical protein KDL01_17435 [Actinospica durhamensis]|uniref:Uncharacterized protein n=1 Tax=Actinospica durhamensis TaxID=1508375 RepID=A0A941IR96_9ACTN|nr:hypothetical protein [Actinospica durhamensis]MBR7835062.1 hypothetical protein [Actinospica durhamensis]
MAELDVVAGEVAPLVIQTVRAYGTGVLDRAQDATGDVTVGLARRSWALIRGRAHRPAGLDLALADLADAPDDADNAQLLLLQIRKVLTGDPELLREVGGLLGRERSVTASGVGAMAVGGDSTIRSGPAGLSAGVINGPAVVMPGPTLPDPE